MAILKYYKVGSDGKIQRLRRECECSCQARVASQLTVTQAPSHHVVLVSSWLGTRTGSRAESAGKSYMLFVAFLADSSPLLVSPTLSSPVRSPPLLR
jgi:hypothetical protein